MYMTDMTRIVIRKLICWKGILYFINIVTTNYLFDDKCQCSPLKDNN